MALVFPTSVTLHLDHIGTKIRRKRPAKGTGHPLAKFQNLQAVQRARHSVSHKTIIIL